MNSSQPKAPILPRLLRTNAIVITKRVSVNKFSFGAANESMVYRLIRKLAISKSVGLNNIYSIQTFFKLRFNFCVLQFYNCCCKTIDKKF